ncbi:MAG: hypothetical protein LIP23_10600, partial [Planctomycetes bacterium]|nr:hypothetical protein [Planctomycetota bacterium]
MVNNDDNQSVLDLVRVCKMHYEQGKTQAEIGAALGVSHAKISKMLAKSEELGLISISINDPFNHMDDLTRNLKEKYGLKNVAVAPVPSYGAHNILERLGIAAANLLLGMVHPGEIIGISGGRTLLEMLDKIKKKPLADSMIVPLLGGYGDAEIATRGSEIAYKLAEKFSARIINMPVPGLGRDAAEVAMFLNNPYVKKSIGWIRKCSIAVFGIGSADEDSSLYTGGLFNYELLGQLSAEQAVGCICFC